MRTNTFFNRFFTFLGTGLAVVLSLVCVVYHFSYLGIPFLDVLSISTLSLLMLNTIFLIIWSLQKSRKLFIPLVSLLAALLSFGFPFKFVLDNVNSDVSDIQILSYNVRNFNEWRSITKYSSFKDIFAFVKEENPDIVCFQEFNPNKLEYFTNYPFKHITPANSKKSTQLILSKYPIISTGEVRFPDSYNNALFVDIDTGSDILRLYNVHLQSYYIRSQTFLYENMGLSFLKRIAFIAEKHREQALLLKKHQQNSPYPIVICGDFNATRYSNTYKIISSELNDSFLEMGKGLGSTYFLKRTLPYRIDYILTDKEIKIQNHQNYNLRVSDHLPLKATLKFPLHQKTVY